MISTKAGTSSSSSCGWCALWWLLLKVQLPKSKPFLPIHSTGLSCSIQRKLWVLSLAFYGFEQKKTQRHHPTSVDSCQQLHLCTSYKHTILEEYLWHVSLEKKITDSDNVCDYFILWKMQCLFLASWSFWMCDIRTHLSKATHPRYMQNIKACPSWEVV